MELFPECRVYVQGTFETETGESITIDTFMQVIRYGHTYFTVVNRLLHTEGELRIRITGHPHVILIEGSTE